MKSVVQGIVMLLMAALIATHALAAQPPVRVPLDDPVYVDLDGLITSGLVRYPIYGQRPYTRLDVVRMVADANVQIATHAVSTSVARVLRRLTLRFPQDSLAGAAESSAFSRDSLAKARSAMGFSTYSTVATQNVLRLRAESLTTVRNPSASRTDSLAQPAQVSTFPIREAAQGWSVEALALGSPNRALFEEPVGNVAADINPLVNNRNGRRYARGANIAVEVTSVVQLGSRIALQLRPRIATGGSGAGRFAELTLQDLSASVTALNTTFEVGRQPLVLGEGMEGGLLMSTGSKSLNMVRLASDKLFRFPGFLRYAGQLRYNVYVADLGPRQVFPHSKIAVWKVNSRVNPYVELGVGTMVEEGGEGSPPARHFSDRFFDFIPVLLDFTHDDSQYSNKISGIDMRFRIPPLHAQVYTEHYLDDVNRVFGRALVQDAGHIGGVSVADLGPQGALAATAEFHHTGLRYYRHRPFTSGIAYNRSLLGDQIGPAADGGYLRLRYDRGGALRFELNAAVERMGGDILEAISGVEPDFYDFHIVIDQSRPSEWRHRLTAGWTLSLQGRQQVNVVGGVERVRDANFVRGERRVRGLLNVKYSWLAW